jgi:hypothetical protein
MRDWFPGNDPDRRHRYFSEIDHVRENLGGVEGDPPDTTVVKMLAIMVEEDGDFESHILDKQHADPPWKDLRQACAGWIFELYIRETEAETWP